MNLLKPFIFKIKTSVEGGMYYIHTVNEDDTQISLFPLASSRNRWAAQLEAEKTATKIKNSPFFIYVSRYCRNGCDFIEFKSSMPVFVPEEGKI